MIILFINIRSHQSFPFFLYTISITIKIIIPYPSPHTYYILLSNYINVSLLSGQAIFVGGKGGEITDTQNYSSDTAASRAKEHK